MFFFFILVFFLVPVKILSIYYFILCLLLCHFVTEQFRRDLKTSHANDLPLAHRSRVMPPGRLLSSIVTLVGSFVAGI